MITRRAIWARLVIVALAMALPGLSLGQVWLKNYTGSAASWIDNWSSGLAAATKLQPAYTQFRVDSIRAWIHHQYASTVTAYVRLYEDDGTITAEDCGMICAGPGTLVWTSAGLSIPVDVVGVEYGWSVPNILMTGPFVVAVKLTGTTNGNASPLYTSGSVPCCEGYAGGNPTLWWEHHDALPDNGREMIRVRGTDVGIPNPPRLSISVGSIFYGNALIPWQGGPEPITDTLIFTNIGGGTDTVTSLTSTNPDFTWTGAALPWYLGSGQSVGIDVTFQTVTPGWRYGNLLVTHTGESTRGTTDTVALSGIGFNGHWLENFYNPPDPLNGDWFSQQDSCVDEIWAYYSGGYSDQCCQAGHQGGQPECFAIDWMRSSPFRNPDNAGVQVRWKNEDRFNFSYYHHAFYWTGPDCTLYHWVADIGPTVEGEFVEEGPHSVNAPSDSIQVAFLYVGENADSWFIDDIRADSIPPSPPEIIHEHHSDDGPATWISPDCIHLTCQVVDPNNDPLTVTLWYRDHATPGWSSVAMTPVVGCESMHLYEITICDLDVCHTYDYYFQADDDDPGTPTTFLPVNAPVSCFQVDILDNTKPQMAYDNGITWYVRYDPDYWETRFAVRFTPASYPYALGGAMVMLGASGNVPPFPDDDHEDIVAELYDDNGAGGKPGTMIGTPYMNNGTSWNEGTDACDDTTFAKWVYIKIDPCVTITDGNFYIAVRNRDGSLNTDKEAFAYDSGPAASPYRTWIFYADIGQWGLDTLGDASDPPGSSTNLMIRAIQCACVPSAPTNLTAIYRSGNVQLRWTDQGQNLSYRIYRSTTDPFSGFGLLATISPGVQFYADPIGANTKAFYRIQGSCDPPSFAPPVPPTETGPVVIGPVRRTPSGLPATLMLGEQLTLEEQLKAGIMPKKINKIELEKIARAAKVGRISHSSWNLK